MNDISIFNWSTRPTQSHGRSLFSHMFSNLEKQNKRKNVRSGVTMGLAEWIIDDTCLVYTYIRHSTQHPDILNFVSNLDLLNTSSLQTRVGNPNDLRIASPSCVGGSRVGITCVTASSHNNLLDIWLRIRWRWWQDAQLLCLGQGVRLDRTADGNWIARSGGGGRLNDTKLARWTCMQRKTGIVLVSFEKYILKILILKI